MPYSMRYTLYYNMPQSQERLNKNKANIKTNYPYAIVVINLTLLLADLLSLRDNK